MGLEALLSSQVIGLNEAIDDQVAALLVAGTGITLTYNDGAGTLTIASSGGLGGSTGSTDNRVLRSDGTGGSTVQNSAVTIDDSGNISGLGTVACGPITISATGAATKVLQWSSASSNYLRNDGVVAANVHVVESGRQIWMDGTVLRLGDTIVFGFASGSGISNAIDVSLRRNATGPAAEIRAAGGLRVCDEAGSAFTAIACGAITSSGTITASGSSKITSLPALGGLRLVPSATHNNFYGIDLCLNACH